MAGWNEMVVDGTNAMAKKVSEINKARRTLKECNRDSCRLGAANSFQEPCAGHSFRAINRILKIQKWKDNNRAKNAVRVLNLCVVIF